MLCFQLRASSSRHIPYRLITTTTTTTFHMEHSCAAGLPQRRVAADSLNTLPHSLPLFPTYLLCAIRSTLSSSNSAICAAEADADAHAAGHHQRTTTTLSDAAHHNRALSLFSFLPWWYIAPAASASLLHSTRPLLCHQEGMLLKEDPLSWRTTDRSAYAYTPPSMKTYMKYTAAEEVLYAAATREHEVRQRPELCYLGYTTPAVLQAKMVVMNTAAPREALQAAVVKLEEERRALCPLVGQEVPVPPSAETVLQRLLSDPKRMEERSAASAALRFTVAVESDGTEVIQRDSSSASSASAAAASAVVSGHHNADCVTNFIPGSDVGALLVGVSADLDPSVLRTPEAVVRVQLTDVHHISYLMGTSYRRLGLFDEAEAVLWSILSEDLCNVDAIESLLEMYVGLDRPASIRRLLDYVTEEFSRRQQDEESRAVKELISEAVVNHDRNGDAAAGEQQQQQEEEELSMQEEEFAGPVPLDIAVQLLTEMVVEAAVRHCREKGEGSTSRFFLNALSGISKCLTRQQTGLLIESLLDCVDGHLLYSSQPNTNISDGVDDEDEGAGSSNKALSLALGAAFLKMLLARNMDSVVEHPIRFRFMVLTRLHMALRRSNRRHESYRVCELLLRLYRQNSALYRQRVAAATARASASTTSSSTETAAPPLSTHASDSNKENNTDGINSTTTKEKVPSGGNTSGEAAEASGSSASSSSASLLDDLDESYQEAYFQYVNDRALDSPMLGKQLCLELMDEFPQKAAPWVTLALLLHREDTKKNLPGAIAAAEHGLRLEPLNLHCIAACANFYKADKRFRLHDVMMDRFRLLSYMIESGASDADLAAVGQEIAELERAVPAHEEEQDPLYYQSSSAQSLADAVWQWEFIHAETKYPVTFDSRSPVSMPSQQREINMARPAGLFTGDRYNTDE